MPLFPVILRDDPDHDHDLLIADEAPAVGEVITLASGTWRVMAVTADRLETPDGIETLERIVCERA